MASPFPYMASCDYFAAHGIFIIEDDIVGQKVKEVDDQGLANDRHSWDYFKDFVVTHTESYKLLKPFLDHPNPLRCHTFGPEPGQVFCFWPQEGQSHRLVVSMWSAGSEIIFYYNSNHGSLTTVPASNGMFEASPQSLKIRGDQPVSIRLEKGGMVISDLRMLHGREKGFMVAYRMDIPKE